MPHLRELTFPRPIGNGARIGHLCGAKLSILICLSTKGSSHGDDLDWKIAKGTLGLEQLNWRTFNLILFPSPSHEARNPRFASFRLSHTSLP
eukprot:1103029-Pelagomonas_calceolata.AAC.1